MGCGESSSTGVSQGAVRSSDPDLARELSGQRMNKRGGVVSVYDREESKRPEDNQAMANMFEMEEAGAGDQALAVKPYQGALKEPTQPPAWKNAAPGVTLTLEYVYGYRSFDSRQNLFYTSNPEKVVYMAAALGVVLSKSDNTQKFFGAGNVKTAVGHSDDITSLAIHPQRDIVATGETGSCPKIFVWKSSDQTKLAEIKCPKGARNISCLSFSHDGRLLAACAMDNEHSVRVYDWAAGTLMSESTGGPDKILDVAWARSGLTFCTAGVKHIYFWTQQGNVFGKNKGIFGQAGPQTNFTSVAWMEDNRCLTGGTNGLLYVWSTNNLQKTYQIHPSNSTIHSLACIEGTILSGGSDNFIHILDTSFTETNRLQVASCPRALDKNGSKILCGMRNGSILELDLSGAATKVLMESHSDGEVWGLTVHPKQAKLFMTTGDDNKLKIWDCTTRKCIENYILESVAGPQRKAGAGASSMSPFPPNQQARAVVAGPNGHIAIGHNDGHVTIKSNPSTVLTTLVEPREWIEAIAYSPDGNKLAVGSHDNFIYIYDVRQNYKLMWKLSGHSSMILSLDWSVDGNALHSTCGSYELLFWDTTTGQQVRDGATRFKDEAWHKWTAKLGWPVQGIYGGQVDLTHVNTVDRSGDKAVYAVGNDWGLVELFGNPNNKGAKSNAYRAHSEHVTSVKWSSDDRYLFSAGGYDNCVMQWRKG